MNDKAPLDFATLATANKIRCEQSYFPLDAWSPTDWACAVAGEVGEMCNFIKKRRRGDPVSDLEIGHEIADAVLYLDLLAQRHGLDLGELVRQKFNIVSVKKGSSVRL